MSPPWTSTTSHSLKTRGNLVNHVRPSLVDFHCTVDLLGVQFSCVPLKRFSRNLKNGDVLKFVPHWFGCVPFEALKKDPFSLYGRLFNTSLSPYLGQFKQLLVFSCIMNKLCEMQSSRTSLFIERMHSIFIELNQKKNERIPPFRLQKLLRVTSKWQTQTWKLC